MVHQIEELPEAQEEDGILLSEVLEKTGCHHCYQGQPISQREIWAQGTLLVSGTCAPSAFSKSLAAKCDV